MEKIKGLAIELDLDHLSVDRGLKGLKDNLRTVNSEMKHNMSAFDRSERSVEKYETRLTGLNKKLEVQKVAVAEARKEYEEMVNEHGRGSKEAEKAAREYNNQASSLNNLERYIERTKDELVRFEREQRIANSSFTKLGDKLEAGSKKLETASKKMGKVGSTLTNKITKPAVGAATALASLAIFKGFQRLVGIDTARAKLVGLGHDAESVEEIMNSALDSVRGTSFGMDEAATAAASAVAAGIKPGKDLTRYLSIAGDAAAIAGSSMGEMGSIFGKVQTAQKAYTGELNQLADRGIPIFQWLAKEAGVSAEAVRDMASDGEISSEMFLKAIETNIGGAAKTMGDESFAATVKNIGSDIGRIGANFLDSGGKAGGFFSKIKPMLVDFRGWLEKAEDKASVLGVKFGEAFENMIEKVKSLKKRYDDLSPAQQDLIKKVMLIAPAVAIGIGPAITLFSKLTIGVSGVLKVASSLSKAIGVARGAGLVAGLASLGPLAVGGIAVAGLAAVAVGLFALRTKADEAYTSQLKVAEANLEMAKSHTEVLKEQSEQIDKTTELIEQTKEQMEVTEELVGTFEELADKSKLTTDEFGEFLTLQTELEHTKSPQSIQEIEERMEELRKKSGLSKDEFNKLLESNTLLAEQFPESGKAVDDYGNIIMDTTGKLQALTQAELERMQLEIYNEMIEDLRTVNSQIDDYNDLLAETLEKEDGVLQTKNEISDVQNDIKANEDEIKEKNEEILDIKEQMIDAGVTETWELAEQEKLLLDQIINLESKNNKNDKNLKTLEKALSTDEKTLKEKQEQRDTISEMIDKNNTNYDLYIEILGKQYDINVEKGKENEAIDKAIKKREEEIKQLEEKIEKEGDSNGELQQSIEHLESENSQLDDLKGKLDGMNDSLDNQNTKYTESELALLKVNEEFVKAGGLTDKNIQKTDVWNDKLSEDQKKDVKVNGLEEARKITEEARKSADKSVNLKANWTNLTSAMGTLRNRVSNLWPSYAKGTPPQGHQGGDFVAGEKGTELVKLPSGKSFLTPSVATFFPDMPRGTHVVPHQETKRIIKNAPHYAEGTRGWLSSLGNSEFARLLLANDKSESNVVVNASSNNEFKELLKETIKQNGYLQKMVDLLMSLLDKDLEAVLAFEPVYNAVKQRMNEDNYSQRKQRRR